MRVMAEQIESRGREAQNTVRGGVLRDGRAQFAAMLFESARALCRALCRALGRVLIRQGGGKRLELIETLSLGGRRQMFLIQCDGQSYLVGAGSDTVGTIMAAGKSAAAVEPQPLKKRSPGPWLGPWLLPNDGAGRIRSVDPVTQVRSGSDANAARSSTDTGGLC